VTLATGLFSPFNYESYWTPGWSGETLCSRNRLRSLYFRSDMSFDVFVRYASATSGASTFPGFEITYDSNRFVFGIGAGFIF
jgi:hypothetical protein